MEIIEYTNTDGYLLIHSFYFRLGYNNVLRSISIYKNQISIEYR